MSKITSFFAGAVVALGLSASAANAIPLTPPNMNEFALLTETGNINDDFVTYTFEAVGERFLVGPITAIVNPGNLVDWQRVDVTLMPPSGPDETDLFAGIPISGTEIIGIKTFSGFIVEAGEEFTVTIQRIADFEGLGMNTNVLFDVELLPIPLPAALPLLAAGMGGLVVLRLRRRADA